MLAALLPQMGAAAPKSDSGRYLVRARSAADYGALQAKAVKEGARVLRDMPQLRTMVSARRRPPAAAWPPTGAPSASPPTTRPRPPSTSRRPPRT
jgi:hypothetical protein